MTTKEKIQKEALTLFSEKGYGAVSVGEIAKRVGIKAPSLYKHYKSKQEIFNGILDEMSIRYEKQAASMCLNGMDPVKDEKVFENASEEMLIQMGIKLFVYFLHDEYVSKFRKMLTIEQYHNEELASLYTKQYVDDPLLYQGMVFGLLSQKGVLKRENSRMMAIEFYAPLCMLLTLCDRQPEKEKEALELLEQHFRQFCHLYKREE